MKKINYYSLDEVKKHNSNGDYWVVINGGVYDVSRWASYHPGGELPIRYMAGHDCTDVFRAFHLPSVTEKKLPAFKIGEVKDEHKASIKESSLDDDFLKLRKDLERYLDTDCKLIFCRSKQARLLLVDFSILDDEIYCIYISRIRMNFLDFIAENMPACPSHISKSISLSLR